MTKYISLLRGINVSGQKSIKMAELAAAYQSIGFEQVRSYIQSGNVIFEAENVENSLLAKKISEKIAVQWGFEVPVMVKTKQEWQAILAENPFLAQENIDKKNLHITFLSDIPSEANWQKIQHGNYSEDTYILVGKNVYLCCPKGYGNTKLTNTFFENKLKLSATTRNWQTVEKIAELLSSL